LDLEADPGDSGLYAIVTTFGLLKAADDDSLLYLAVGAPTLAFVLAQLGTASALMHRVLTPSLYFMAIVWAKLLTTRDWRAYRVLLAVAMIGINISYLSEGRIPGEDDDEELLMRPGDVAYMINNSSVPLHHWADYPIYATPLTSSDGGLGSGLSDVTLSALGIRRVDLAEVEWTRAWVMWARKDADMPAEKAALDDVLSRWPHELLWRREVGYGTITGEMWLLTRDNSQAAR